MKMIYCAYQVIWAVLIWAYRYWKEKNEYGLKIRLYNQILVAKIIFSRDNFARKPE